MWAHFNDHANERYKRDCEAAKAEEDRQTRTDAGLASMDEKDDEEDEDDEKDSMEDEITKLFKQSGKDWTRLLRGRTFTINEDNFTIMDIKYHSSSKFAVSGWVASYRDMEGAYDELTQTFVEMNW